MDSPREKVPRGVFPALKIVLPTSSHRQTFIILHGRGSWAERFADPLLNTPTSSGERLTTAFPHAKLIFLTASRSRATIWKKSVIPQWFDHWHMEPLSERNNRQDLMREGLHKSCTYVHGILEREIREVGAGNVVLWGLSQGAATSLVSLLSWDGEPFAAVVGMCGYLPFANHVEEIAGGDSREGGDLFGAVEDEGDPLARFDDEDQSLEVANGDKHEKSDPKREAVEFLRNEIDLDHKAGMAFQDVPVFLGHGTEDEKVDILLGREAKSCLDLLGMDARMIEYEGLGHWYNEEMLGDIFAFLREKLEIRDGDSER